jgi:hypothetical protein
MLIEEHLQLARTQAQLVEEHRDVEPDDGPDDHRLVSSAYVIAKREQLAVLWLR